ncbi:MAG TPA: AsmA-like C-terminal domain-containing protein [Geobacteraceae bacterium]|nr:AsmA-like C-terminal domain-containing protein [Geobacteraceae bacterium]
MTTKKNSKKWSRLLLSISLAAVFLLIMGGVTFYIKQTFKMENFKTEILDSLQSTLHRRVIYESGKFSFHFTPAFTFKNIVIMEKDGSAPFLTADRLTFRIALFPLLRKRLLLRGIVLEKPSAIITRDKSGVFNISDLLESRGAGIPLHVRGVRIRHGKLYVADRGTGREEVVTILDDVDLAIGRIIRGKTTDFKFSATVVQGRESGEVRLNGKLTPSPSGKPLLETTFAGSVKAGNLVVDHYWAYYARYVPFRKVLGRLDLDTNFKGRLTAFTSAGSMTFRSLRFDYPQIFHAVLTPKNVSFHYDMELTPRDITVKSLNLDVDALNVKGSCALKDIPGGDLLIEARAKTSTFRLEEFAGYIPYGVIADDAAQYIEEHIKGGTYKLDAGSLVGHVSQIAHMERGTNYNVLSIRGTVVNGLVSYGPDVPTFNTIKGNLAMQGKDFILTGMQGNFGSSPFTLDGRITDYPLNSPCGYPFTMTMKPRPAEVLWLVGRDRKGLVGFSGEESILTLQGSGFTSGYALSGSWDLSPATYSYRDIIAKPGGTTNHLFFQSLLSRQGAKVSTFRYELMPLVVTGSGEYQAGRSRPLSFAVRSNNFPIQPVAAHFPRLAKQQPAGRAHLSIQGTAGGRGDEAPLLGGEITLAGASFKPAESMRPLTNVNGTVVFSGESLKSSKLTARLGTSTITGSGVLTGFTSPTIEFDFSTPALDLADMGLRSATGKVTAEQVRGSVSFQDDTLTIKSLSGRLNRSIIRASGTVRELRNPRIFMNLDADYLDMGDVMLLAGLDREDGGKTGGRSSFRAVVNAEAGKFHQLEYRKLHADVHLEQKILYVEEAACGMLGGTFAGSGRVDFGATGGPRYQTSLQLKDISAGQFLQALGTNRELTGTMTIEGDLIARGNTLDQVKASSLGNLRLHCEKGTLRKFSLLSKLFSILNVSQLFKFKLPDMVSDGMPYNEINASFALRDGLVTTDDLFIDSNAMSISIVGDFDLIKEQLDVTIGVKPLQTIDKVMSRIPVVGWVLTGKNRSLITTYFEAKGSLDNPKVKSITAKSMAKGVFNIFSRLFSLPAKLVTNTGEVIINR